MRTITCFGDQTSDTFLIIPSVSLTKITRSHGMITLWLPECFQHCYIFSCYRKSKLCKKRRINIWNYRSPCLQYHLSNAGHFGWQHMHKFTKWRLWRQNTIPLMPRDHLVGNRYFVPFFVFYTEAVMLGPRFILESIFYTQSVMLSPCFIPSPQSVVRSHGNGPVVDLLQ